MRSRTLKKTKECEELHSVHVLNGEQNDASLNQALTLTANKSKLMSELECKLNEFDKLSEKSEKVTESNLMMTQEASHSHST